jgi:hypothetical protein
MDHLIVIVVTGIIASAVAFLICCALADGLTICLAQRPIETASEMV